MSETARSVLVTGRVQGVGYRQWCAQEARRRGVAGFVRNLSSGAVEAVFAGPQEAVAAMIEACRQGPRGALVGDVRVSPARHDGLPGFRIEPTRGPTRT
jgi:acylphosphatase